VDGHITWLAETSLPMAMTLLRSKSSLNVTHVPLCSKLAILPEIEIGKPALNQITRSKYQECGHEESFWPHGVGGMSIYRKHEAMCIFCRIDCMLGLDEV